MPNHIFPVSLRKLIFLTYAEFDDEVKPYSKSLHTGVLKTKNLEKWQFCVTGFSWKNSNGWRCFIKKKQRQMISGFLPLKNFCFWEGPSLAVVFGEEVLPRSKNYSFEANMEPRKSSSFDISDINLKNFGSEAHFLYSASESRFFFILCTTNLKGGQPIKKWICKANLGFIFCIIVEESSNAFLGYIFTN